MPCAATKAAVNDGLANVITGLGTTVDKNTARFYSFMPIDQSQVEASYRTGWLTRKIVDVPPKDMVRGWREWQAEKDQIALIEAEERKHQVKAKALRALILARLYGGSAIILGVAGDDPATPLAPARITRGRLSYLHVMSRHQLSYDTIEQDPVSPWFGQPKAWRINGAQSGINNLHPSRVIAIKGQPAPEGSILQTDRFWGDPIMQSIGDAVANADLAQSGFATLINEASIDVFGIPDMLQQVTSAEYEARLIRRLTLANLSKSTHRALIKDAAETWEQHQFNWSGIPAVIESYLGIVAGAADIPVTRLLGRSPGGLGSNGDNEERDYLAMIAASQESDLAPALDRIDEVLLPSVFGARPDSIYWQFAPLSVESAAVRIGNEKVAADALKVYADAGLVGSDVLARIVENRIIESGEFPGSESAFADANAALAAPGADNGSDPSAIVGGVDDVQAQALNGAQIKSLLELIQAVEAGQIGRMTAKEVVSISFPGIAPDMVARLLENAGKNPDAFIARAAKIGKRKPIPAPITDAAPRTLYIRRDVENVADLAAWAAEQGLPALDDGLHVTIAYSRTPVDWMRIDGEWNADAKGRVIIPPGGVRIVEPLGDKTAVLLFTSSALSWRHQSIINAGASHDWPDYQPHISLTSGAVDLAGVVPYRGQIVLGAEVFEELRADGL